MIPLIYNSRHAPLREDNFPEPARHMEIVSERGRPGHLGRGWPGLDAVEVEAPAVAGAWRQVRRGRDIFQREGHLTGPPPITSRAVHRPVHPHRPLELFAVPALVVQGLAD